MHRNKITIFFAGILLSMLIFSGSVWAQSSANTASVFPVAKVVCGPWLQAIAENEFTVMWTTNVDAAVWVEVAPNNGTHFYAQERPKYYQTLYGRRVIGKVHQVLVKGLQKGTTYRYRIFQQALLLDNGNSRLVLGDASGSDIKNALPYTVTTLDPNKEKLHLLMVNDIHGNDSVFRKLTQNVRQDKLDFVVFNGDMLTQIESEKQIIDGYLNSACQLFASDIPFYAIRGNHENRGTFSYEFFNYFPSPNHNAYYSFRQGPAYFIFLDSGEDKPDSDVRFYGLSAYDQFREEEAKWLENVVRSDEFKASPIKVVFMHMPPAQRAWHGALEAKRLFVPILNEAGIDLMLSGHIHRHSFIEAGTEGINFPILINSNTSGTDIRITKNGLDIKISNTSEKVTNEYHIKKQY